MKIGTPRCAHPFCRDSGSMRAHFAEKTVSFSKRMLLDNSHDFSDVSALLFHIAPSKSSKIIRILYLKITGLKRNVFSTKWVCIRPWSLQNGRACPHGLYFHVHVLLFRAKQW